MSKLTRKDKIAYSLGSLGMGVTGVTHMLFLVWYFIHPQSAGLPYFIPQDPIFAGLTIMGLLLTLRTIFDAISDPLLAYVSDKMDPNKSPRTKMIKWAAIPFALSIFMVFMVPNNFISSLNVVWIAVWLVINTFLLTVYSINHEALLAKITKSSDERIDLGTFASASWFAGFVFISLITMLWGPLQEWFGIEKIDAILLTFGFASLLGAIALFIPGILINESKFNVEIKVDRVKVKVIPALKTVLKYKNYRKFVFANTLYTSATFIFESGLIFFITILAVMNEGMVGTLTLVIGAITLAMYPLINRLAKSKGRKFVLLASFVSYFATFVIISILSANPSPWLYLVPIVIIVPFSQAGFGILPVVIASDNAEHMVRNTGVDMSAMYMGISGLFRKLGGTIAMILFTSLLYLGKEVGDDLGIRLIVVIAAFLSALGFFVMRGYNEHEVMGTNAIESE